jgi:hypothetical protein
LKTKRELLRRKRLYQVAHNLLVEMDNLISLFKKTIHYYLLSGRLTTVAADASVSLDVWAFV